LNPELLEYQGYAQEAVAAIDAVGGRGFPSDAVP
jgi:hypothetical protein